MFICFTGGSIATIHHKEQFISIVIYLVSKCEQFIFYREGFLERWARRQINFDISPNQIQYELYSMGKQGTKQYKKTQKDKIRMVCTTLYAINDQKALIFS